MIKTEAKEHPMKTLDTTPRLFPLDNVDEFVLAMNQNPEDDWTYRVDFDPKGTSPYCRIAIYDEDGEFVAFFS